MRRKAELRCTLLALAVLTSCDGRRLIDDEGSWLGARIGKAAEELRRSPETELVLSYSPLEGVDQKYWVGMGKMVWCPNPPCSQNGGGLTVTLERGRHGSTTHHMLFVAVPARLQISKEGRPTQIVLRKTAGDTISVVALR
jgi:hypothetical protein